MFVSIRTILNASLEVVWREVLKPTTMQYVAQPIQYFQPIKKFPEKWGNGEYEVDLLMFNRFNIGKQIIKIEISKLSNNGYILRDNGHGTSGLLKFIRKWDHKIIVSISSTNKTTYIDSVEIDAGIFTLLIWLYAQFFYRWRQYRWSKYLSKINNYQ